MNGEAYKLVSADHKAFDNQFDAGLQDAIADAVTEYQMLAIEREDESSVWTPVMDEDTYILGTGWKSRTAMVLQVVHGRVSIDPMTVLEYDGSYFVDVEKIG